MPTRNNFHRLRHALAGPKAQAHQQQLCSPRHVPVLWRQCCNRGLRGLARNHGGTASKQRLGPRRYGPGHDRYCHTKFCHGAAPDVDFGDLFQFAARWRVGNPRPRGASGRSTRASPGGLRGAPNQGQHDRSAAKQLHSDRPRQGHADPDYNFSPRVKGGTCPGVVVRGARDGCPNFWISGHRTNFWNSGHRALLRSLPIRFRPTPTRARMGANRI